MSAARRALAAALLAALVWVPAPAAGQEIAIEVPAAQCTLFDAAGRAIAHGA